MQKFNIGEKIRIKRFKKRPVGWVHHMDELMGKIATIEEIHGDDGLRACGWYLRYCEIRKLNFIERLFYEVRK